MQDDVNVANESRLVIRNCEENRSRRSCAYKLARDKLTCYRQA